MREGYLIMDYPCNCFFCDLCHELPFDPEFYNRGEMLCGVTGQIVDEYYRNETKPEWCPIKRKYL